MRKEDSLPVRLDPEEKRRLKEAAERMGLNASSMIRLLVHSFVEQYERSGGRMALPPRWKDAAENASDSLCLAAETPAGYAVGRPAKKGSRS